MLEAWKPTEGVKFRLLFFFSHAILQCCANQLTDFYMKATLAHNA